VSKGDPLLGKADPKSALKNPSAWVLSFLSFLSDATTGSPKVAAPKSADAKLSDPKSNEVGKLAGAAAAFSLLSLVGPKDSSWVSTETAFKSVENAKGSSSSEPLAFFLDPNESPPKESDPKPKEFDLSLALDFSFNSDAGLEGAPNAEEKSAEKAEVANGSVLGVSGAAFFGGRTGVVLGGTVGVVLGGTVGVVFSETGGVTGLASNEDRLLCDGEV